MTQFFYDTEFLEDGSTIDLISIGIVTDRGDDYYAVNADCDWGRIVADDWLWENVVPHLPHDKSPRSLNLLDMTSPLVKPKWVIRNEVRDFITRKTAGKPELWAYYGAYDHVALAQLFGKMINLPKGIPMWTHDIMQLIDGLPDMKLPSNTGLHNALEDAMWAKMVQ